MPRQPGINSVTSTGNEPEAETSDSGERESDTPDIYQQLADVDEALLEASSPQQAAFRGTVTPEDKPTASNLWIIGPNRTADGSTILNNGPQFGNFNPAYVYSIGLHGAGYDVTGNTPFALPVILFGTNNTITWGATAGPLDVNDYYQLDLNPANPHEYDYDGEYKAMDKRTETIRVRTEQGMEEESFDIYSSVHGVVTSFDEANASAYAFKRSWKGYEIQSLMGWVHSMKAQNWEQWLAEAEKVATTINWYYADSSGNIGYVSPGYLPIRPDSQDIRLPAEGDGTMEWQGFRPFEEVPQVYNPSQGFITNWNNQSAPGEAAHGDGANWSVADRVNEFNKRIEANPQMTPDEVWELLEKTSYADPNARYFVPYITDAVEASGLPADSAVVEAANRLDEWNFSPDFS